MNEWPYTRALSAHLLYLHGISFYKLSYQEIRKFEEMLVAQYLRNIHGFWEYVTEVCLLGGDYGIKILGDFNNAYFDKPTIYHRTLRVRCPNIPHPERDEKIIAYTTEKFMMIRDTFSFLK